MPQSTAPHHLRAKVLQAFLALLVCYQTFYCLNSQKSLGWDASLGFLTLQSSLEHGAFNRVNHPAPSNLAEDRSEFIVWWTPGQYLVPYWVSKSLDINIGIALRFVGVLCSLGGLVGYWLLYNRLGFNHLCVYLCLIAICSQHYYLNISRVYLGGDLLLFTFAPYIALGVLSAKITYHRRALFSALLCFAAIFLKASALIIFVSIALYLALELHGWPGSSILPSCDWGIYLRRSLILGAVMVLYVVAVNLAYISQGVTISSFTRPFSYDKLWGVPVALAGPLYGAFSFFEPYSTKQFFIPMAFLSLCAIRALVTAELLSDYRRMLVAHYIAFFTFFSYAYIRGMSISYEPRHFRIVGLLLLPGLIHRLLSYRHQTILASAIAVLGLASVVIFHREYNTRLPAEVSASRWGIRQPVSNETLEALHRIDNTFVTKRTIVFNGFGACPALLLEFNNGRKLQDDNFIYFSFKYSGRTTTPLPWYRNSAESIVLIISKNANWYFGPSLEEVAKTFERPFHVAPCFENKEIAVYVGSIP